MAAKTRFFTRFIRIFRLIGWFFATAARLRRLDGFTLAERNRILRDASARCLQLLNVRVDAPNPPPEYSGSLLVTPNHISWLDIFVVSLFYPSSFIAMKELAGWPLIGAAVRNAGTVFIDRSNRKDIDPITAAMSETLKAGGNVCFFPEARTSLGNGVLPLKAALFQAAINSGCAVQPVAMRYYADGSRTEAVSFAHVGLIRSLWQVVSLPEIRVSVDIPPPLLPQEVQHKDRFEIKESVQAYLSAQVLADSPAPERLL